MEEKISVESNKEITSHESFVTEYDTLIRRFDNRIRELEEYFKAKMKSPSELLTEELNRLKMHRFRLKETLKTYEKIPEEVWPTVKSNIQDVFRNANQELTRKSDSVAENEENND